MLTNDQLSAIDATLARKEGLDLVDGVAEIGEGHAQALDRLAGVGAVHGTPHVGPASTRW
jgi:hypothetical protein